MRTIKFRGKRIDNGEWVYGFVHQIMSGAFVISSDAFKCRGSNYIMSRVVDIDTVGQFTGLFDNNGKEIFEGDLVKHESGCSGDYNVDAGIKEVEWLVEHNEAGFWIGDLPEDCSWNDTQVVGNIHDKEEEHD